MNQQRTIKVRLPPGYNKNQTYPVIYLLDGDWNHNWVTSIVHRMESVRRIPNSIIVSFENVNRPKDLIQNPKPFRSFIINEIKPWVEKEYNTKEYSLFIGHSLAGVFALETLAQYPDTFDSYLSISPTFPNQTVYQRTIELFDEMSNTDSFLYFTLGKEDKTNTDKLQKYLNEKKTIHWKYDYYPDDNHMSVPLISVSTMMNLHYRVGSMLVEQGKIDEGLEKLDKLGDGIKSFLLNESFTTLVNEQKHDIASKLFNLLKDDSNSPSIYYLNAKLSKSMGDSETEQKMWDKIDELSNNMKKYNLQRQFNRFSYQLLSERKLDIALKYFKKIVENYPSSPNAYNSLGDAYNFNGDKQKALETYTKSVKLAKEQSDPMLSVFERSLNSFKATLN